MPLCQLLTENIAFAALLCCSATKMEVNFDNKVVLVTGASAGIGEATALMFAKYGAKLAIVGTNESNLTNVAERCAQEEGNKPLAIIADLSTDEGCEITAKKTLDHFERLDVLVNNAAIGARTCIEETDMATFDRVFNLDVRGVYNLTRLLVPALVESNGNIVNVSSIGATIVTVGSLPYNMAKAALDHFTRLVALELAPKGVRVNAVSPGLTVSKFVRRITDMTDSQYEQWVRATEEEIPMGKACTGDDIARMILHVASDNSRLVTGAIIPVDGCLQYGNTSGIFKNKGQ